MSIDFPSSGLTVGQTFAPGTGVIYQWDGMLWKAVSQTGAGGGDFYAQRNDGSPAGTTPATWVFNTVVSGNLDGSYNNSNGQFRPPPGRYHLYTSIGGILGAGPTAILASICKNGVVVEGNTSHTAGANYYAQSVVAVNVDANGSDVFTVQASANANVAVYSSWFGAFPIPAAGTTAVPSTSWRQLGRVVPTAGQATVDFQNIPPDINSLMFEVGNVVPQTNDVGLMMRCFDGTGAIDAGNNYVSMGDLTNNVAAVGATVVQSAYSAGTGILLDYNQATSQVNNVVANGGISVHGNMANIRNTVSRRHVTFNSTWVNAGATQANQMAGGGAWLSTSSIVSGLRFLWGSGNYAAGGAITLWGSP